MKSLQMIVEDINRREAHKQLQRGLLHPKGVMLWSEDSIGIFKQLQRVLLHPKGVML